MSEPMSSGEIEDVLSSIRKLVSEDLRPMASRAKSPQTGHSTADPATLGQQEADKLMLTPALRVVEVTPAHEEEADQATQEPTVLQDNEAKVERAPVANNTPPPLSLDESLRRDPDDPEAHGSELDPGEPEHPGEQDEGSQTASDGSVQQGGDSAIGAALSSIGSAVDQHRDEWESETGDGGFASLAWKAPEWVEEAEIVAPATAPVFEYGAQTLSPEAAEAAEAAALAEIEAAERAAAFDAQQGGRSEANVGSGPQAHRQNRPSPDAEPEPDTDLFAEDDPLYDEALLRDLVRDIIREELSGTLGERITRNVRKLVRAEIARAMTAREFE